MLADGARCGILLVLSVPTLLVAVLLKGRLPVNRRTSEPEREHRLLAGHEPGRESGGPYRPADRQTGAVCPATGTSNSHAASCRREPPQLPRMVYCLGPIGWPVIGWRWPRAG